jgi:two-component system, sensor histidine kinase
VTDTGPGIPEAERGKIFEEFHQIGNPERDREQGFGLGLAIVRGLSRLLEHPLVVRSFPERAVGSEFALELPAGEAKRAREEEVQSSRRPHSLAGRRILIIDDERDIRDGLGALLESWGSSVISATGLEEALARQAESAGVPDVVICDYRLRDGATGAAVLAELEGRWQRKVPSVIITGDTSPERIHEAKRSGRPVLFKPVVPGKLRALLTALVERAADPAS